MAQYKVGNKYLNDDEFEAHSLEIWGFWLFVISALITGMFVKQHIPDDWSKELRYGVLIISCGLAGYIMARLAPYIRTAFFIGIFLAMVGGALYWAWTIV